MANFIKDILKVKTNQKKFFEFIVFFVLIFFSYQLLNSLGAIITFIILYLLIYYKEE